MSLLNLLVMNVKIDVLDGLLYALIGFAFVFIGIALLIGIVELIGFIMQKTDGKLENLIKKLFQKKKQEDLPTVANSETASQPATEEVPVEIKAAIIAAIMAYYTAEKPQCEFVVLKIKRI